MHITGLRPTRVTALPAKVSLPGYPMSDALNGMGGITPALINMSNGAVVRNLMGATTNDTHQQRIWGTLAAAEIGENGLRVRIGAAGQGRMLKVRPHWDELGELAAKTGHGGGDFWVLHYFARQILTGEPGPFDLYRAADCTIPGLLAYRSSVENGRPYDVPDFRNKKDRKAWRKKAKQTVTDPWSSPFLSRWKVTALQRHPADGLAAVKPFPAADASLQWRAMLADSSDVSSGMVNLHARFGNRHGIAGAITRINVARKGTWNLCLGHDGGAKLFVDRKPVACQPIRSNPALPDRTIAPVELDRGVHTLQVVIDTDHGMGWGFFLRFGIPKAQRKRGFKPWFPKPVDG